MITSLSLYSALLLSATETDTETEMQRHAHRLRPRSSHCTLFALCPECKIENLRLLYVAIGVGCVCVNVRCQAKLSNYDQKLIRAFGQIAKFNS